MSRDQTLPSLSEAFLVYPENRFAYTAMTSLKGAGGRKKSPAVYLYGPSGVGKSHLVRHYLRLAIREHPALRVGQWTGSEFAAAVAEAAQNQALAKFQGMCRALDVFVLEDVHALERRKESQQQFLATFDELLSRGCQVVLTSRKPPGELTDFPYRLINRFQGSVLSLIKLPGNASRESLLEHFANSHQIPLPKGVVSLLARSFPVSPRELLGLLRQLENRAIREKRRIDIEFAKHFLKSEVLPRKLTVNDIAKAVARHFDISLSQLRSRTRVQQLVFPRQCALLLARELTSDRLEEIGKYFGGRDHSTVVHSCKRLQELSEEQPEIRQHLTQIRSELGAE